MGNEERNEPTENPSLVTTEGRKAGAVMMGWGKQELERGRWTSGTADLIVQPSSVAGAKRGTGVDRICVTLS